MQSLAPSSVRAGMDAPAFDHYTQESLHIKHKRLRVWKKSKPGRRAKGRAGRRRCFGVRKPCFSTKQCESTASALHILLRGEGSSSSWSASWGEALSAGQSWRLLRSRRSLLRNMEDGSNCGESPADMPPALRKGGLREPSPGGASQSKPSASAGGGRRR